MRFLIISHATHKVLDNQVYSYAPYVREMNLWLKYVDEVEVIAPQIDDKINAIDLKYEHKNLKLNTVSAIQFTNIKHALFSFFKLPVILFTILRACHRADHIHLRCPGNMGLLGSLVQVLFPKKSKTAKYAGNWDPESKQPLSYRIQKRLLSTTLLTKNMQVLVYGNWPKQSKNIKSFFTATYKNSEIEAVPERDYSAILKFVFVGSLVVGKRPLLAIQIIESLSKEGYNVSLDVFGDGHLKNELLQYISENKMENLVNIHGNQTKDVVKAAMKNAHFSILPSKSEGWPKAIAEAMFFGAIPIVTKISCVPYMLDYGQRGILIEPDLNQAVKVLQIAIDNKAGLKNMSHAALNWSQAYTLDAFEGEIAKLLKQ